MSWIRVVVVNVLVLVLLAVTAEVGLRMIKTATSCFTSQCDFSPISDLQVRNLNLGERFSSKYIGITRFDEYLGYVPKEGFDQVINASGWTDAKVTITADGFRSNGSGNIPLKHDVLAVGDSFTFGDSVSNHETWPACLERKIQRGVANGGVFGYGAAQALKRASLELKKRPYSLVVLSVLVGDDFNRDRFSYRSGFPKPALVKTESRVAWAPVSDPNQIGTKYNPSASSRRLVLFYEKSLLVASGVDRFLRQFEFAGDRLTTVHPNAADLDEVIEWTLTEFAQLQNTEKTLLLQYNNLKDEATRKEREKVLKVAERLSLRVVDTFDQLGKYEPERIWNGSGHHTPFGNEIVCEYLFKNA